MKNKIIMLGIILISTVSLLLILFYIKTQDIKYINSNEIESYSNISMTLNGAEITSTPTNGYYKLETNCENGSATWNNITHKLKVKVTSRPLKCTLAFVEVTEDFNIVAIYIDGNPTNSISSTGTYYLDDANTKCYNGSNEEIEKIVTYDDLTKNITVSSVTEPVYCRVKLITTNTLLVNKIIDDNSNIRITDSSNDYSVYPVVNSDNNPSITGLWKENRSGHVQPGICSSTYSSVYSIISGILGSGNNCATYYYRGNVVNNWVAFAGMRWRIIRINEDGSIRMLYAGTEHFHTAGISVASSNMPFTSSLGTASVGYFAGNASGTTHADTHTNAVGNFVYQNTRLFYYNNISPYLSYLNYNGIYCNDRTVYNNTTTCLGNGAANATSTTCYGAYGRITVNHSPSFVCSETRDQFTYSASIIGNKKLEIPVGLPTADEAAYAGSMNIGAEPTGVTENQNYMTQYNGWGSVFTMTPATSTSNGSPVFFRINTNAGIVAAYPILQRYVVTLKSCVKWSGGNGTIDDPYKVTRDYSCYSNRN